MSTVDQRVVEMQFDNKQFEAGIAQSRSSLTQFSKQLQLSGATKGLEDVDTAAKKFSLENMTSGIEAVSSKFSAMTVVGVTALANIASKAVDTGLRVAKALTLDPITAGFANYETQIKATQTILANTASEGTKIGDVNKVLAELNEYANKTVYNFSEMTANIGTFTAAGVKLKPAAAAIKGIANLAALSGSSSEQASTAMYQLSQAIAAGSVHLQDWNSVVNAGLGGKTFQTALVNTARASGVAIDSIIKKAGSFRESLQEGWLTSSVLEKTLSQFTGDLSQKQIQAMGFTEAQAKQILKTGQVAVDAATKIKTMSQLTDALKEEVATAWSSIFKTIFGNIGQATTLFSGIHTVAENALTKPVYALNKLLEGVDKLGGRKALIDAFSLAFHDLTSVLKPVGDAFREIFPPATAEQLFDVIKNIHVFAENLQISSTTADELKRTFAGVFAVFGIGWDIVKDVAKSLVTLFTSATAGSSGILLFTARIGDWLVSLKKGIEAGGELDRFFAALTKDLQIPIKYIRDLGSEVGSLADKFDGFSGSKAESAISGVTAKLSPFGKLAKLTQDAWSKVFSELGPIAEKFEPLAEKMGSFFSSLGHDIMSGLQHLDFSTVLNLINTGLFAGLVLLFKKFSDKFSTGGEGGGLVHAISESFEELTGTLKTMQGTLKATTLLEIAAAIGLLTISVSTLSTIDSNGLTRAVTAIGALFAELLSSMAVLQKVIGTAGFAKLPVVTLSFILLAAAVDLLAAAVAKLSGLDLSELKHGLAGLTVILAELVGVVKTMPPSTNLISTSLGLIALGGAVQILVSAVTKLSGLSWEELSKGLVGVGGLLASLALFTKFAEADKGGLAQGAGIILLATGIKILAGALKTFASFSWQEIGKGLTVLAGSLLSIGAALKFIPPSSILSAAAVLIVASSLGIIGKALQQMGQMSWEEIAKGLVELAGSLAIIAAAMALMTEALPGAAALLVVSLSLGSITDALAKMGAMSWGEIAKSIVELFGSLAIIAAAMILMTEALPGAAALLVVAAALEVLSPVLQTFGDLSWTEMGKSLLYLAGVFVVLGAAGVLLTPLVPTLLGVGGAVLLLGAGMLAAGGGLLLFSAGLTALSLSGAAGALAIVAIVTALVGLIPTVMKEVGLGIIAFADVIAQGGPAILNALVTVLDSLIAAVVKVTPKIVNATFTLLTDMINALNKYMPHLVTAGGQLIANLFNGIAKNAGKLTTAGTNMVVAFLNAISKNLPKVADSGAKLVINFINTVASTIRSESGPLGAAGGNLGSAIIEGMVKGMANGIGSINTEAEHLAKSAIVSAENALHINSPSKDFIAIGESVDEGFAKGIVGGRAQVDSAFKTLTDQLQTVVTSSGKSITTLKAKLSTLTSARNKDRAAISATTKALAQAEKENKAEQAAYTEVTKSLNTQHSALDKLGDQYDALTTKITAAQQTLTDAQKTLADFNTQITQQYEALPAISADTQVGDYVAALQQQVTDTLTFTDTLQKLRKLGLNDDAYKQLVTEGTADLPFAQQLLAGGKASVDQVNALDKQLDTAAASLGKSASTALYQAAVDSAAGLVKGLQDQQSAIEKQMEKIADAMIAAINKKLGIKSPAKAFIAVAGYSADGLIKGFDDSTADVSKAAGIMGQTALDSLGESLSGMSDLISGGIDVQPTITPVLDLSSVKKTAGQINGIMATHPIAFDSAYRKAVNASAGYMSTASASAKSGADNQTAVTKAVTFNQYNSSPKSLSTVDIYRQTNTQLSAAKGALK